MFDLADIWSRRTGETVRLVSANDHVHNRNSAHYEGLAVDLQSSAPTALARVLRAAGYAVLWNVPGHFSHVHVEAPGHHPTALTTRGVTSSAAVRSPSAR